MSTVMQPTIPHDRPEQLQQVQSGLLQGETLYCVYDDKGVGTGYVALTDLRVIFQNKSLLPEFPAHHNKTAIISVPYSQIASVSILFRQIVARLLVLEQCSAHQHNGWPELRLPAARNRSRTPPARHDSLEDHTALDRKLATISWHVALHHI